MEQGAHGKISSYSDKQVASKLLAMGWRIGSEIVVLRIAPFRGGYYLKVNGTFYALRTNEAASVMVEQQNQ